MDVYGEYLFIENFIAGYGIIRLTALMCGRKPSCARVAVGASLCGAFAFILFINMPRILEFAAGMIFSAILVFTVFSPKHIKNGVKLAAVFYIMSFVMGGAAIAFIFASGCLGAVSNGIFYIGDQVWLLMLAGAAATAGVIIWLAAFIKRSLARGGSLVKVSIEIMGRIVECTAKIDTGNYLREPVSGKPVSVMEKQKADSAWGELYRSHMLDNRLRAVPYSSVGSGRGSMMAVRCDELIIDRGAGASPDRKVHLQNAYIGMYDGIFTSDADEERYTLLLQADMINEGCFAI